MSIVSPVPVTVVPADHLIIVDGQALYFSFAAPNTLHALQWDGGAGHLEYTDGTPNVPLTAPDYAEAVAPYVTLWQDEKDRLAAEEAAAEAARLAEYNSPASRAERLRTERDARLGATDYLVMSDYPLEEDAKAVVSAYRQALRDLPQQNGAPWDGGEEETPWPDMPSFFTRSSVRN